MTILRRCCFSRPLPSPSTHGQHGIVWINTRLYVNSLSRQHQRLEAIARQTIVPSHWRPKPAHIGEVSPSFGMLLWAHFGDTKQPVNEEIPADKQTLIREIPALQERGKILLSDDITLVAEGCDDGRYLSLLLAALTHDGKTRRIRSFFTDGSNEMVNKTCNLAFRILGEKNHDMIHGGICDAYCCLPSELQRFGNSQKIFASFRMGIVGSHEDIQRFLTTRIQVMGSSGVCCYCLLSDSEATRTTLKKNQSDLVVQKEGEGYTEFFKSVNPGIMKLIKEKVSSDVADKINHALQKNPRSPKYPERVSYPLATVFTRPGIEQLVARAGGKMPITKSLESRIVRTQTDDYQPIDVYPLILVPNNTKPEK